MNLFAGVTQGGNDKHVNSPIPLRFCHYDGRTMRALLPH